MSEAVGRDYSPDVVSSPGATLQDVLDDRGMTQAQLSARLGMSRKTINQIIKGKAPITSETALMLERVLGVRASFWSNRENRYREHLARVEESGRLAEHSSWAKSFPVAAMLRLEWIVASRDPVDRARALLDFFGVASPEQWFRVWAGVEASFRRSTVYKGEPGAIAAWLRMGELEAAGVSTREYDRGLFFANLQAIRELTTEAPEVFQPEAERLCSEAGVALVFLPALPKTRVSGATRWLSPTKGLIQLSLRYKKDDQLWFSFFHEAGHLLLHSKRTVFLEADTRNDADCREEAQANAFAAKLLIPELEYSRFASSGQFSVRTVRCFASEQGIAPGIVVGRLQYDRHVPFNSNLNKLKRSLTWVS